MIDFKYIRKRVWSSNDFKVILKGQSWPDGLSIGLVIGRFQELQLTTDFWTSNCSPGVVITSAKWLVEELLIFFIYITKFYPLGCFFFTRTDFFLITKLWLFSLSNTVCNVSCCQCCYLHEHIHILRCGKDEHIHASQNALFLYQREFMRIPTMKLTQMLLMMKMKKRMKRRSCLITSLMAR